jgi:hypothetical protein
MSILPCLYCNFYDFKRVLTLKQYNVIKKKNKLEQALQMIGYVVAEFYANKRLMHGRRLFVI